MMFNALAGAGEAAASKTASVLRVRLIACCVLAQLTMDAKAQDTQDLEALVRSAIESVFLAVGASPERLRQVIESNVGPRLDAHATARVALGPFWRKANEEQRERVALSVRRLLLNGLGAALESEPRARVEVLATRPGSSVDDATVQTRVHVASRAPISINYRLQFERDAWWLYDISIEGVSMLATYRQSFTSRLRRVGMDAFIAELEAR